MQEIKKIYRTAFEKIGKKVAKQPSLTLFGPFKMTFRAIQSNPSFDSSFVPSLEASCINRENVIKQFLRKLPPSKKRSQIGPF